MNRRILQEFGNHSAPSKWINRTSKRRQPFCHTMIHRQVSDTSRLVIRFVWHCDEADTSDARPNEVRKDKEQKRCRLERSSVNSSVL